MPAGCGGGDRQHGVPDLPWEGAGGGGAGLWAALAAVVQRGRDPRRATAASRGQVSSAAWAPKLQEHSAPSTNRVSEAAPPLRKQSLAHRLCT